jgi:hypothetical protein
MDVSVSVVANLPTDAISLYLRSFTFRKSCLQRRNTMLANLISRSIFTGVGITQSVLRRAGRPGFDSRQRNIIFFSPASRPTLGPNQPPIQWVPGALSPGVKRLGREADRSLPCSAEIKKGGSTYTYTPAYVFMAQCLIN